MATIDTSKPLSVKQLGDHLWDAADHFRNKISNQKDYILALLFFKRASDLSVEGITTGIARLIERGLSPDEADAVIRRDPSGWVQILIPEGHSWEDVRNTDEHRLGQALNDALMAIGRANPRQLAGVFERTDFNNKSALPNEDLGKILDHFHALGPLTEDRVPDDMLGAAYEWLIAKFAATSGKAGGEFYTPSEVGRLCARLLEPRVGETGYDPTCGSGGLLLQLLKRAHHTLGEEARTLRLFGQELNPETWAIARMNVLLAGAGDATEIEREDTLRSPAFRDKQGGLRKFDLVIANPPFSPKNWGHERLKASGDPFGRIKHLPPKSHGEMAFVQHMVASLSPKGRMAVVLPNGVFFRGGAELAVREDLVAQDLIEAIVQLPKDLFYGAGIPACILVLNRDKLAERKGKVLFIDGSECFERRDTKNVLRDADIERIAATYIAGEPEDAFSALASTEDIAGHQFNLGPSRYVRGSAAADEEAISLAEALDALRTVRAERVVADEALDELLVQLSTQGEDGA